MKNFHETTLAELVTERTGAAVVFEKHKLDFCCNGKRSLRQACEAQGLDTDEIVSELESVFVDGDSPADDQFSRMALGRLAEYIEETHHGYVRRIIPALIAHTQKVADRHGMNNANLIRIAELWMALAEELMQHMHKEELILFPYVRRLEEAAASGNPALFPQQAFVSHPIQVMEMEHDKAGEIMKEIRQLSNDFTPPLMACTTYRLSFRELKEFETDLHRHIHLENNILFPKAIALEKGLLEQVSLIG